MTGSSFNNPRIDHLTGLRSGEANGAAAMNFVPAEIAAGANVLLQIMLAAATRQPEPAR